MTAAGRDPTITCFGELRIELAGRDVATGLPGRQGRALVAYLILQAPRPVARDELIEVIWPSSPPADRHAAFRSVLAKVRRTLGPELVTGREPLSLVLSPGARVDVHVVRAAVERAERRFADGDTGAAFDAAQEALEILARPLLPTLSGDWVDAARDVADEEQMRALEIAARAAVALGGHHLAAAERAAAAFIEREPFREDGYVLMMEAQARRGNPAEALRTYEQLRVLLRDELGATPSPGALALHERLLRGELPRAAPAPDALPGADGHAEDERRGVRGPRAAAGAAVDLLDRQPRGPHATGGARGRSGRRQDAAGDASSRSRRTTRARRSCTDVPTQTRCCPISRSRRRCTISSRTPAATSRRPPSAELAILSRIFPDLGPPASADVGPGRPGLAALPGLRGGRVPAHARGRDLAAAARARRPALGRQADAAPAAPRAPARRGNAHARRGHLAARRPARRPSTRRRARRPAARAALRPPEPGRPRRRVDARARGRSSRHRGHARVRAAAAGADRGQRVLHRGDGAGARRRGGVASHRGRRRRARGPRDPGGRRGGDPAARAPALAARLRAADGRVGGRALVRAGDRRAGRRRAAGAGGRSDRGVPGGRPRARHSRRRRRLHVLARPRADGALRRRVAQRRGPRAAPPPRGAGARAAVGAPAGQSRRAGPPLLRGAPAGRAGTGRAVLDRRRPPRGRGLRLRGGHRPLPERHGAVQ